MLRKLTQLTPGGSNKPLTWEELDMLSAYEIDRVNGPTSSQATLRLFGHNEEDIRVTLYRDNHAWCPYCQKVWLWLEEKRIPYRVEKVSMVCYGTKETWFKKLVPTGMLPALKLDEDIITESDDIIVALENAFGSLYQSMNDPNVLKLRALERELFRAWCAWLCYPFESQTKDNEAKARYIQVIRKVESQIKATDGPYFLSEFSSVDCIFIPYLERMNASLFYYKGYSIRDEHQTVSNWFDAIEERETYRGTQSDFHTHCHDLPPQMGGCYKNQLKQTATNQRMVDSGKILELPDTRQQEVENAKMEAIHRLTKHRKTVMEVNPVDSEVLDIGLRCALTLLATERKCQPPKGAAVGLMHLKDRICVPRDMSIFAARHLRYALETTAELKSTKKKSKSISEGHRKDQNPAPFRKQAA